MRQLWNKDRDQKHLLSIIEDKKIQRFNFSRRSYDCKQRDDNSRDTSTFVDIMNSFIIQKKTSTWLEIRTSKHTSNVSPRFLLEVVSQFFGESNYSGRMGLVSSQTRLQTGIFQKLPKTCNYKLQIDVLLKEVERLFSKIQ